MARKQLSLRFYLLDVNHELVDGKPEVRLWGIDQSGKRILICDRNFLPYFYLVLGERASSDKAIAFVESTKASMPKIRHVELIERRYFGRPARAVKVICSDPEVVGKYSEGLKSVEGVAVRLEDDIRPSTRYIIDYGLKPCGWHEVQAECIKSSPRLGVGEVYSAYGRPRPLDNAEPPQLRILAFSMMAYSEKGAPRPDRDPIIVISTATSDGQNHQYTAEPDGEKRTLEQFLELVTGYDPDIVVGFGCNRTDWPYMIERASTYRIKLAVDRTRTEPHPSVYGHISVTGRANIDLRDLAEDLLEVKMKTIQNVAEFLGVTKEPSQSAIDESQVHEYWENLEKRETLLRFSLRNAQLILAIAEAMFGYLSQLSYLTGLPLDHVVSAAFGFRVDSYLMMKSHAVGELIPKRTEQPYFPYRGGVVLEPKVGLHSNIAVLDLASMYPNLMILYNLSPDTLVKPSEVVGEVYEIPEVGHRFRKEPAGFYKQVLSSLLDERMKVKKQLAKTKEGSVERRVFSARERAVKVLTNAVYGYAGWIGARWYVREVAESAAALGRSTIRRVVEMARQIGLEVIYGDTDSIFVKHQQEKVETLLSRVESELKMEIKVDKLYTKVLFTEAKKRYAGLLRNGSLDIVGLEVVRGDWSEIARVVQEKVLELVLREGGPNGAIGAVKRLIRDLSAGRVPFEQLVIWKTLTKDVDKYEVRTPHVAAAKAMMKAGYRVSIGDKVGYVVAKGQGKLSEKVKPHFTAAYDEIDIDYYVNSQVIPAAMRVLGYFGVDEQKLKNVSEQPSLADFA